MRAAAFLLALTLVVPSVRAESPRGNPDIAFRGQQIDSMIAAFMRDNDVPGLSLAIVQAPYITRATGFGIADVRRDTLVSLNTMFDIGEMRNAFTAVAAMQLVEEGKLQLTAILPLVRNPSAYGELEGLIEQASGTSYESYVQRRQFEPLRLQQTRFARDLKNGSGEMIQRGERHRRFLSDAALIDPSELAAGDGADLESRAIYASASDISIWDIALAGEILIKDPALRKILYEPPMNADGKRTPSSGPWFFPGHPGLMIATGDANGFSSLLARFTHRDELICVTLLVNRGGVDLTQLARDIAGAYNSKTGPPTKAAGMRAQQSPYSVSETIDRLAQAFVRLGNPPSNVASAEGRLSGTFGQATAWQEGDAVWVAVTNPSERKMQRVIDQALLEAIAFARSSE